MKKIQTFFILCVLAMSLHAQSTERYAIGNAGGSYYNVADNFEMDYTLGEFAVTTLSNSGNTLTQGFQQPFKFTWVAVPENSNNTSQIIIFPNPVVDQLNISFEKPDKGIYRVIIYDMLGQLITDKSITVGSANTEQLSFDFSPYATGNYFVRIMHETKLVQTAKIVKINQ